MPIDFPDVPLDSMHPLVTAGTRTYQIEFEVIAELAPRLNAVNLKTLHPHDWRVVCHALCLDTVG